MSGEKDVFARSERAERKPRIPTVATRARRAAASALCRNGYFKTWLGDVLDDLCLFEREEGMLTDFGQGIRAAANRIKNRLLEVPESVEMLAELSKKQLADAHTAMMSAEKEES